MGKRLNSVDEWNDKYFPVKAFFNEISSNSFIHVIENMSKGIGHGCNIAYCIFPDDIEADEEPFDGVKFGVFEDEILIDYQKVFYFMKEACISYVKDFPEDEKIIKRLIDDFCKKYSIKHD